MVQYRLWLHHREVDQHLRGQQLKYEQELAEINEHIARIEKMAVHKDNALLTALTQQINIQEHINNQRADTIQVQPEHSGATQTSLNRQKYQTPPSTYGQKGWDGRPTDPALRREAQGRRQVRPQHAPPASSTWGDLPNFATQDTYTSEAELPSLDTGTLLPETTEFPLSSDLNTPVDHKTQKNDLDLLPWWLRHLMHNTPGEQEPQQTAPIDQQSMHTNEGVERWFTRRTRLVHYDERQESQKQ
jgi:hypothetical protein